MKLHKTLIASMVCCFALQMGAGVVFADEFNDKVGTRNFAFLKRDIGARAVGLGGAFTGLADDESALFYNPAGVSGLNGRHLMAGYQNFVAGINSGFVGYVHPLGSDDVLNNSSQKLGAFLSYVNYGSFVRTISTGEELGTFGASSFVFGGHYSRRLGRKVQVGANAKLIYSNLDAFTSTGAAADFGLRYTIKEKNQELRKRGFGSLGIMVQNVGATLSAFTAGAEKEPLPTVIRFGVAGRPRGAPVTVSADAIKPIDNDIYLAVGFEYDDIEKLVIRAGWSSFGSNYKTVSDDSPIAGFSFGLGFKVERYEISYALTPMNDLGESHRISISHNFDPLFY